MEVERVEWLYDVQTIKAVEFGVCRPTYERVHMYGVDGFGVGMLFHDTAYRAKHSMHRLT